MGKIDGGANQAFREERIYLSRLRDEFAKAALTGLTLGLVLDAWEPTEKSVADEAYKLADAMLKAREVKRE